MVLFSAGQQIYGFVSQCSNYPHQKSADISVPFQNI